MIISLLFFFRPRLLVNLDNVFIAEFMVDTDSLRIELC